MVAHNTPFGNIVSGQIDDRRRKSSISHQMFVMSSSEQNEDFWNHEVSLHCNSLSEQSDDSTSDDIRKMWNLEWMGVDDHGVEENCIFKQFREDLQFDEKERRYVATLPWKQTSCELQDNYDNARKRYLKQMKRLSPEQRKKYLAVFKDWEEKDIIEEVPSDEMKPDGRKVFYLPHRPVIKEDRVTTKIRPVFDGGAKGPNGVSLNDVLYTGPKLQNDIMDILMRFRKHEVALTADISKAFLQIKLREEDQDSCRFFLPDENGYMRVMRFLRLPFGLNSSPFILNATLKVHLEKYGNDTAEDLSKNLYVDDFLSGTNDVDEASQMFSEAKKMLEDASMPLTKWISNLKEFREQDSSENKVLGLLWNSEHDEFHFNGLDISSDVVITVTKLIG